MRFLSGPVACILAEGRAEGPGSEPTTLEGSVLLRLLRISAMGLELELELELELGSDASSVPFGPMSGLPLRACSPTKSSPPSLSELAEQKPASRSLELGESKNKPKLKS